MSSNSSNNAMPPNDDPPEVAPPAADDGRWFAYELHDGLLQWVIGARMQAQAALAAATEADSITINKHRECLSNIKTLLDMAAEEGRSLIRFIDEVRDAPVDLHQQLEQFCESVVFRLRLPNSPRVELTHEPPAWPRLSTRQAWSVFRILQQAIQNAIVHSQADRIEVHLSRGDLPTLTATVSDAGVGFDTSAQYPNHFGLRAMQHRAKTCRGSLAITSAPGQGCRIQLTVPAR